MMHRLLTCLIFFLLTLLLPACGGTTAVSDPVSTAPATPPATTIALTETAPTAEVIATEATPAASAVTAPTAVVVTDGSGATLATQEGPLWVLLSGVDEHGLLAEPELSLLAAPAPDATPVAGVPTGVPAAVAEIRQTGPQGLRRFYRVQTTAGEEGWVSDFYVRRLGYLYDGGGNGVQLYLIPGQQPVAKVANVTPVRLLDPTGRDWWLVETADRPLRGWVAAVLVVESPKPEFLITGGQGEHEH